MKNIPEPLMCVIDALSDKIEHLLIAIDGRCASGKTTLALHLKEHYSCNLIPMDHFFLQPHQRTEQRISEPGGNVDYERFYTEALSPLMQGTSFAYRPYDCRKEVMMEPILVRPEAINIIEGAYSCHPTMFEHYDVRVFLNVDKDVQLRRIRERDGDEALEIYKEKWIPLEELYFKTYNIEEKCHLALQM